MVSFSMLLRCCNLTVKSTSVIKPQLHFAIGTFQNLHSSTFRICWNVSFSIEDYPGYDNKRGDGTKADDPSPSSECCTYKFVLDYMIQFDSRPEVSFHGQELSPPIGYMYNRPISDVSQLGWFTFNICGVSMGEPGLAGCGGIMIDEDGKFRFVFSAPLGILEYEVAELCAFEASLRRLLRLRLLGKRSVLITSTSYVAVSWVKNPRIRPMHLLAHFIEIDTMLSMASGVRIELVSREENYGAECLAKKAILTGASFEAE